MQVGGGVCIRGGFVPAAMLGFCVTVESVSQVVYSYSCVCIVVLLPECVPDLFAHPCVSVVYVSVGVFVHLCFRVNDCVQVGLSVPVVVRVVSAGASVQPRVRVGAVAVSAAQRAEDHGAAGNCAAMFDLQVDGIVVDLQRSYKERRKL